MRILIDMQGAQTESRFRGIGRYSLSLAQALARNRGKHEIILALNGQFPETVEPIRNAFEGLLPRQNISVWYAPGPVLEHKAGNDWRRRAAEAIREAFLASLNPDVVHVTSLFEGYVDDAVTSIGTLFDDVRTSVTLYDLIPLRDAARFLAPNPVYEAWYRRKLAFLGKADLALAISDATCRDAQAESALANVTKVNVSAACAEVFSPLTLAPNDRRELVSRLGIQGDFILCAATVEPHKNIARLLRAYARLPKALRARYSLVLVGKANSVQRRTLRGMARGAGVDASQVIIAGYVSDEDLAALYNLCTVSVVASYYEGLGLPALEAMSCGAAVIGSNVTSIPEVIQDESALFDPFDDGSICAKLKEVLEDGELRRRLRHQGIARAAGFSWDETASRALRALETMVQTGPKAVVREASGTLDACIQAIADLTPTPDKIHGLAVADALARTIDSEGVRQLLVDVSEIADHDAKTGIQRVALSIILGLLANPPTGFVVEPVYATTATPGYRYARHLKARLTKQACHGTDEPIEYHRGDIFFALDYQANIIHTQEPFLRALKRHGILVCAVVYDVLSVTMPHFFRPEDEETVHRWLTTVAKFDGVLCISRSVSEDLRGWFGRHLPVAHNFWVDWFHLGADIENSAPTRGLPQDADETLSALKALPTFLMVGTIEPRSGHGQALDAFEQLWREGIEINLAIVGGAGWMLDDFIERLRHHPQLGHRLFWLESVSDQYLQKIYARSVCLIAASYGEGFGLPLIESARYRMAILARDIPVFREVAGTHAAYFGGVAGVDLASAVRQWLALYRADKHPKSEGMPRLTWGQSAAAVSAILLKRYEQTEESSPRPAEWEAAEPNLPDSYPAYSRQLLVDISEVSQRDAKTGCQRVTRAVLNELLRQPPEGFAVNPVFASTAEPGYFYARRAAAELSGRQTDEIDTAVGSRAGDIFLGLDYNPKIAPAQEQFLLALKRRGVGIWFVVYDILPVTDPGNFPPGTEPMFRQWLKSIAKFDGVICISRTTVEELRRWYDAHLSGLNPDFRFEWFHSGADIESSTPTSGLPLDAGPVIERVAARTTFLTVGTIEPRKEHALMLSAFDELWSSGVDADFVIVGKQGWEMEDFVERLRRHPEMRKRLLWLDGVSDEYLEALYGAASCLIMASKGEGFGLPLIEAARQKLPILARDIPAFREVAGGHASYFSATNARELAVAIRNWLVLYRAGKHIKSDEMPWQTWAQGTEQIKSILLKSW